MARTKASGFIELHPIPGGRFDQFMARKRSKVPKDSDKYLNAFVDAYGVDAVENMQEVNIGDYVYDKGTIYALNMNVGRSIPWIEDGLKSVERRVLWIMYKDGLYRGKSDRVAGIAGDMIKYVHPHGDQPIADTIYRLGREKTIMIPYIKRSGSFGNMETMKPAAPRYASASLSNYAYDCFFSEMGAKHPIFDVKDNYKFSEKEPVFLTSRYPNVLMQWNQGIGKGAAAWLGAFNSRDIFKVALKMLDDPDCKVDIYPDTPVPIDIVNKSELRHCFDRSNFKVRMRGKHYAKVDKKYDGAGRVVDKYTLVFTSMPLTVTGEVIRKEIIAINTKDRTKAQKDRRLPEVLHVDIDTSEETVGPGGIEIIIEYEKGYDPEVLAEKLYKSTSLDKTIGVQYNMITDNTPDMFTPRKIMQIWISQRYDQKRRYYHQQALKAARDRAKYEAICIILQISKNTDDAIAIIRAAKNNAEAIKSLMKRFEFTEFQARCITDLQLKNLPKMDIEDVKTARDKAQEEYKYYRKLLTSQDAIKEKIREELEDGLKKYGKERNAEVLTLKEQGIGDPNAKKFLLYNDTEYYCLTNIDDLVKLKGKLGKDCRILGFCNGDSLAIVGRNGLVKVLNGYSISETFSPLSFELISFPSIAGVIALGDDKPTHAAILTDNGYGKVITIDELFRVTKSKVIQIDSKTTVAGVVPIYRSEISGVICAAQNDTVFYTQLSDFPQLSRSALGNRIIKDDNLKLTRVFHVSNDATHVLIYGEFGYGKVLDINLLKYPKKKTASMNLQGKSIMGVTGVVDGAILDCYADKYFGASISIGKTVTITPVDDHPIKFRLSTSISGPVKMFKAGRNEYYEIMWGGV